jgi:hypothetical protein
MLATGVADVILEERPKLALNRRPCFANVGFAPED